jgi:hypothetical protein
MRSPSRLSMALLGVVAFLYASIVRSVDEDHLPLDVATASATLFLTGTGGVESTSLAFSLDSTGSATYDGVLTAREAFPTRFGVPGVYFFSPNGDVRASARVPEAPTMLLVVLGLVPLTLLLRPRWGTKGGK